MKNKYMEIQHLYKMLRNMYMEVFPSSIPSGFITDEFYETMIINYLTEEFHFEEIIKTENGYELRGTKVDVYKKMNEHQKGSAAYYMKELSHIDTFSEFMTETIVDLKELHEWLESESYISSGRMTEKFMKQNSWLN
ncbi:hypothetical protein [Pectobacterium carotovorum]|uniref:Uncharacterized protein n=1 Tax=Pectobacterium carotovorum TaxID=554 RepID=A0A419AUM7_PECCA|nr:hypothetical protein [Pectobacterium carotovorum]RJL50492.1 hypothetical protein D5071_12975 [Pectobacterium carotovorum]